MFNRLRSSSIGSLIDLASPRPEPVASVKQDALLRHLRKLNELWSSPRENWLKSLSYYSKFAQPICLKQEFSSLMVATLSDMPKSLEAMRENAGFLTLITVLASLRANIVSEPESTITAEDTPKSESSYQRRIPSISISSDRQLGPLDSPKSDSESPQPQGSELQEERDAKIEKLFGISFAFIAADFSRADLFSAVRIKFNQQREPNTPSHNLACRASEGSSHSNAQPASGIGHGANAASIPTNQDSDSKYSKMAERCGQIISHRLEHLRVKVADAVLLLFALHADVFNLTDGCLESLEDNYNLYFLSLKAIEILADSSRHSQIALNSIQLSCYSGNTCHTIQPLVSTFHMNTRSERIYA
ncbi:hypothetical protein PCASD_02474 [Puccinia coronata f. sp. avenae]|uniref:Uncharacterized protein n=1 Tax=Puccinia coronata f. sp. avenae TaxID=200324 RepID=A0A2N5VMA9_9BASI|nr:hypothetical protein PCASD_02474 [Puccinia coronata f. sp. avenae]